RVRGTTIGIPSAILVVGISDERGCQVNRRNERLGRLVDPSESLRGNRCWVARVHELLLLVLRDLCLLLTTYHSVVTDSIESIAHGPRAAGRLQGWRTKAARRLFYRVTLTLYRASVKPVSRFCSLRASAPWQTCSLDRVPGCLAYIGKR